MDCLTTIVFPYSQALTCEVSNILRRERKKYRKTGDWLIARREILYTFRNRKEAKEELRKIRQKRYKKFLQEIDSSPIIREYSHNTKKLDYSEFNFIPIETYDFLEYVKLTNIENRAKRIALIDMKTFNKTLTF